MDTSPPQPEPAAGEAVAVTIATVALNAADDLPLTLESALAQDLPGIEFLVLDGMSTDATHDVLSLYAGEVRIETVEDAGIFYAMNEAARRARGTYILFMNAGDRFHGPSALSRLLARAPADADVVFGTHVHADRGVETFRPSRDFATQAEILRRGEVDGAWLERFPAHQATLTRTALLRRLGYDTALRVCADHDFLLRAHHAGARVAFVDEIVATYAGGGFSARNGALCRLEMNAVYRAFSERPEAVDALLSGDGSPFGGTRSPFAGGVVSGMAPYRAATAGLALDAPHRLVLPGGARLVTPRHAVATALELDGLNPAEGQVLTLFDGDRLLATASLARGAFAVRLAFAAPVAPGTIIDLVTSRAATLSEGSAAALAVTRLGFETGRRATLLSCGRPVDVRAGMARELMPLLAGGWWGLEDAHVWSTERGELTVRAAGPVGVVRLALRANPAIEGQRVAVEVNGAVATEAALTRAGAVVDVPVGDGWRADAENRLALVPSAVATVGADPRALGVALSRIELA